MQYHSSKEKMDLARVAVHEAGHAITTFSCNKVVDITSVYIESNNGGVFYTTNNVNTAEFNYALMVMSLAGLAAEIIVYNKCNPIHAEKDLNNTLNALELLITQDLTSISISESKTDISKMYSRSFSNLEKRLLNSAFNDAKNIINAFGEKYFKLVSLLLTKIKISQSDIENILGSRIFIKLSGQMPKTDVYFYYPRNKSNKPIIGRIKQWLNNNLFLRLQKFLTRSIRMLNS